MSNSNYTGRMARSMADINPHMSGPVELMPEPSRRGWADLALYIIALVSVTVVVWQS